MRELEVHDVPVAQIREFLIAVLQQIAEPSTTTVDLPAADPDELAAEIFRVLTSQRFGYLGRKRSEPYRGRVIAALRSDLLAFRPVRFYFDIGPGYHASIDPETLELSFDVGLAELMALGQVATFRKQIGSLYGPGVRFWLVVDNLCGLATNGIALERSLGYVRQLRDLIEELGLADHVFVLVESESSSWEAYQRRLELESPAALPAVDSTAVENVQRFLGRPCSIEEAAERIELYRRTGIVTEALLEPHIEGVRLTQRATEATLGFRAFPGGDQRIQVGQLALVPSSKGRLRPLLLTSRNVGDFAVARVDVRAITPRSLGSVLFAAPLYWK